MEASKTLSKSLEVEFDALMGSLTMMSQGKYSFFFDLIDQPTFVCSLSVERCFRFVSSSTDVFTEESEILWPDSNRLDSGQFELVSKPYALHQSKPHSLIPSGIISD